jgi:hypothetical protein
VKFGFFTRPVATLGVTRGHDAAPTQVSLQLVLDQGGVKVVVILMKRHIALDM